MGKYEDELAEVAKLPRWQIPGVDGVKLALNQVNLTYSRVATESGFEGRTGSAISDQLAVAAKRAASNSDVADILPTAVDAANAALLVAKYAYEDLPGSDVDPGTKELILKGSWAAGPLGALAGAAGVKIWEDHLSEERETAAKAALDELRSAIEVPAKSTQETVHSYEQPVTSNFDSNAADNRKDVVFTDPTTGGGPPIATPKPKPIDKPTGIGIGGGGGNDIGTIITDPPRPPVIDEPWPPRGPDIVTETDPPTGTDDPDLPDFDADPPTVRNPSVDSGMNDGVAGGGGGNGGVGGGIAGGVAGAGGLIGGAKLAGQLGGRGLGGLGGGLGAGGLGAGGLGSGGLAGGGVGAGGVGANGAGVRGATGMGAGGMGGNNIMTQANGAGAGGRGGAAGGRGGAMGAGGGGGGAGGRGGSAGAGGRGGSASAGGRGGNNAMAPGQGGKDDKKKRRTAGMLGLAAPSIEDDELPTGRSAAAGPGGRDAAEPDEQ